MEVLLEAFNSLLGLLLAVSLLFFVRLASNSRLRRGVLLLLLSASTIVLREPLQMLQEALSLPYLLRLLSSFTILLAIGGVLSIRRAFEALLSRMGDKHLLRELLQEEVGEDGAR